MYDQSPAVGSAKLSCGTLNRSYLVDPLYRTTPRIFQASLTYQRPTVAYPNPLEEREAGEGDGRVVLITNPSIVTEDLTFFSLN
jgi:hypothetical protein